MEEIIPNNILKVSQDLLSSYQEGKQRKTVQVHDISFGFHGKMKFSGLVGESGCGKIDTLQSDLRN